MWLHYNDTEAIKKHSYSTKKEFGPVVKAEMLD